MSTEKGSSRQGHASWIVALVVGLVVGAVGSRMAGVGGGSGQAVDVPAGWVKEADLPPGTLAGLSEQQKRNVLKGITERYGARPQPAPPRPQEDPTAVYRVPLDDSPRKGPADALVTVVESSDFECPFCKRALPTLKQIEETYRGKVRFVFKHNPLPFHPKALPSAMAAEEARAEGGDARFWAMHDKLFEASPELERPALEKIAQQLGLDPGAFRRALDGNRYQARIDRDQALARGLGASGTPTFFVNGRKVVGALPFEAFKPVIDEELRKAEAMVKAGTPAREVYDRITEKGATAPVMVAGAAAPQPPPPPAMASKVPIRPDDPARGPKNAKVTLVVFSDFQCPFCSRVEPTLKQLEDAYRGDLRVVWKNQPLPMHPQAMPAAVAAEAAREQGKFWPMHDLMFTSQAQLAPAQYEAWARQAGLDLRQFKAALESPRVKARIEEDMRLGASVGANGTPTSFVNCRQLVGAQPLEAFKRLVDEEVKKADDLLKKGARLDAGFYQRVCDENVKAVAAAPGAAPPALGAGPAGPVAVPLRADDPLQGNPRAPVTIVEFSDFECPFCGRALPTIKQVEQTYGSQVRVVWKHQPLAMHPQALPAALAAEAAREQGKFWEMHDKLFQNQQALDPQSLERYAREVGLDLGRFRAAQQDPKVRARVEEDQALAARLGINGTPTFVVNGEKVVGAQPFERFKEVIDAQLQKVARK